MVDSTAIAAIAADLATFFPNAERLEPDIITELSSIMRLHELSVEDLFYKWESFCIKMECESANISLESVRSFKRDVQDALERSMRMQTSVAVTGSARRNVQSGGSAMGTPRAPVRTGDVFGMLEGLMQTPGSNKLSKTGGMAKRAFETPTVARIKSENQDGQDSPNSRSPNGTSTPSKFSDRQKSGDVLEVFGNASLPDPEYPIVPFPEARVKLAAGSDQKKVGYKPLAMKLSEVSEILDDRIDDFIEIISQNHGLDLSVFGNPASQGTSEIVAVGRIANDSAEGRLNAASVVLETSRRMGNGLRVPLNLKKLRGYSFFPGQIIAARGTNTSGNEFVVNHVLEIPSLPNAASTPEALEAHRQRLRGDPDAMDADDDPLPLNSMIASGPYTTDDSLAFEPLAELCKVAGDKMVDALILMGPFIDIDHPMIASGDFDLPEEASYDPDTATLSTAFKFMISPHLARLSNINPQITIVLIPSIRDAVNKHVSWPQDSFVRKELGLPRTARILTNPMTLSINEAVFGLSSQDILFELRREELVGGRPDDSQLSSRLCRYLLEQRHFFPLFPPSDRSVLMKTGTEDGIPQGASLDTAYLKLGEMLNARPDVMVLPSTLPPFVKVVESVLMINPGTLSRRAGAGTYARMAIYPPKAAQDEDGTMQSHSVFSRSRIEIVRI
ncbi:DNA polymerase alpha subunit B [Ceratocystis lukuohia]|uniref:DNA polymerase alpha subunit B n=1 Tax=Ceratocystis lukuohia TaxID=2019550 RepID=A0ABR4MM38_9PEZI